MVRVEKGSLGKDIERRCKRDGRFGEVHAVPRMWLELRT